MTSVQVEDWTSRDGLRFAHRLIEHPAPQITPTLFVSGAFQTMASWARFAEAFAPYTSVLLVDPPGMGRSDLLPPEAGIDFLARCLEQVLDERGIERVNIVAASYGTPSAYYLARSTPDRVERIALVGTMKELPFHMRAAIAATVDTARRRDRQRLADQVVAGMLCHDPERRIDRRASAARMLRSSILRLSDAELGKYVANTERLLGHVALDLDGMIRGPRALVFTGEHDGFTRPADCREVATAFERAWFTTVRRADHLLHLQQWDAVIGLLLGFMRDNLPPWLMGCSELEEVRPRASRAPAPAPEATAMAGSG